MLKGSRDIPSGSRRVSLFRNGVNQAVRIPREFELPTQNALLFREGNRLIIEAYPHTPSLLSTLEKLTPLEDSFPDVDEALLPAEPINLP
jgi:antitoxin VapB